MKKFSDLIEDAVNCIKTYNRVIKTIDSHADDFLAAVSTCVCYGALWDGFAGGNSNKALIKSNVLSEYSSKTPTNECLSSRSSTAASATKTSSK